jgi:hypothetical protein
VFVRPRLGEQDPEGWFIRVWTPGLTPMVVGIVLVLLSSPFLCITLAEAALPATQRMA